MARPTATVLICGVLAMAGGALSGCGEPYTLQPLFRTTNNPQFFVVDDTPLRSGEDDEASVVAIVPRGTLVEPEGEFSKEAQLEMKVSTPQGNGWVYSRFVRMREPPEAQE
jgi:hypothetical protein